MSEGGAVPSAWSPAREHEPIQIVTTTEDEEIVAIVVGTVVETRRATDCFGQRKQRRRQGVQTPPSLTHPGGRYNARRRA